MSEHVKADGKSITVKDEKGKITNNVSLQGRDPTGIPTPAPSLARTRKPAEEEATSTATQQELMYRLSVASIIGIEPSRGGNLASLVDSPRTIQPDANSEVIENEVSAEFGLKATRTGGKIYGIPIVTAQRINDKYPMIPSENRFGHTVNPKAVQIARRYMSLFGNKL